MSANLEDALLLSSDWIAIKEAALIELRRQVGQVFPDDSAVLRQIALIGAWSPGAPPRRPCGDLIVKSAPVEVDGLTWHIVEVDRITRNGTSVRVFDFSRREPFTVVLRATKGEVL